MFLVPSVITTLKTIRKVDGDILVSWTPPKPANGPINGYRVTIILPDNTTIIDLPHDHLSYNIIISCPHDNQQSINISVMVSAFNGMLIAPPSDVKSTSICSSISQYYIRGVIIIYGSGRFKEMRCIAFYHSHSLDIIRFLSTPSIKPKQFH